MKNTNTAAELKALDKAARKGIKKVVAGHRYGFAGTEATAYLRANFPSLDPADYAEFINAQVELLEALRQQLAN